MAKQVEAYQVIHTAREIEELLTKVQNLEHELVDSNNPISSKAVFAKFEELKKIISEGKMLVANAITEKGVDTAAEATFQELANNILSLSIGEANSEIKTIIGKKIEPINEKYINNDGIVFNNLFEHLLHQIKQVVLITCFPEKKINEIIATQIEMEEIII